MPRARPGRTALVVEAPPSKDAKFESEIRRDVMTCASELLTKGHPPERVAFYLRGVADMVSPAATKKRGAPARSFLKRAPLLHEMYMHKIGGGGSWSVLANKLATHPLFSSGNSVDAILKMIERAAPEYRRITAPDSPVHAGSLLSLAAMVPIDEFHPAVSIINGWLAALPPARDKKSGI